MWVFVDIFLSRLAWINVKKEVQTVNKTDDRERGGKEVRINMDEQALLKGREGRSLVGAIPGQRNKPVTRKAETLQTEHRLGVKLVRLPYH